MATKRFSRPAEHDLKYLPQRTLDVLRREHIPRLSANPRIGKQLHGPLRGLFAYDFHTEGISYRIAYELMRGEVIIVMIDTRDNFYKKLSRRIN